MPTATIIGCAGYTGQETLDRLLAHPELEVVALGSDSLAGEPPSALDVRLNGGGSGGSPQQQGSAFHLGALQVIEKGRDLAAEHLEAASDDIAFDSGTYSVAGTDRRVTLLELAAAHRGPPAGIAGRCVVKWRARKRERPWTDVSTAEHG